MTGCRSIVSLLCLLIVSVHSQSYTPQPLEKTTCSTGQYVSYGNNDVQATTTHTATTSMPSGQVIGTLFNTTHASTTIDQLSFGILDNLQITGIVSLRLGLYAVSGNSFTLLGETSEISLYATGATTIFGNLQTPVTIQPGSYAVTVWSDSLIYTGVNAVVPLSGFTLLYSRFGMPPSYTAATNQGGRAVKMSGCSTGEDPWVYAGVQYYSFCLSLLHSEAAPVVVGGSNSAPITVQVTVNGVLAASTTQSGSNSQGQWFAISAGKADAQVINMMSTAAAVAGPVRKLVGAGGTFQRSYNQRIYPSSNQVVDASGFSLVLADGTQYIIQYQSGKYEVMVASPGFADTYRAETATFTIQQSSRDAAAPTCTPPFLTYTPQTFTCPPNTSPVSWLDDAAEDAAFGLSSQFSANQLTTSSFTVHVPDTTLYQLTFRVGPQMMGRFERIRMGLFTNDGMDLTLVSQTNEIFLGGLLNSTLLAANLPQPVALQLGRSYSIGVAADSHIAAPGSYAGSGLQYSGVVSFQGIAPSARGFATNYRAVYTTTNGFYMAANGCTTQPTTQYSFCAAFVYPTTTQTYSGVITTTANTLSSAAGKYRAVISGSGTSTRTPVSGTPVVEQFTIHDMGLNSNKYLYESGSANGMLLDEFGLTITLQSAATLAVAIKSGWSLLSDSFYYKETQSSVNGLLVQSPEPLISSFTAAPYSGSAPACVAPPRPLNLVQPASVARAMCLNADMSDVFGDVDGANFAAHADGTLIQANRIYTQQFTADTSATIRQLAVGLLQNADRTEAARVRLGLYSASSNTLLGQTAELSLNQAVPQVVVMDLNSTITLEQGQTYYVAIHTSAQLEVAHTGVASSPSMATAFAATGLPTTFASSGNDVSPAIAAYACVRATHSFCGYYQYHAGDAQIVGNKQSVSYFYSGLLLAGATTTTNGYGTYLPVYAASGRLSTFRRSDALVSQTAQVLSFWQVPGTVANIYTSATNSKTLDGAGILVQVSNGAESNLVFNLSINKYDESFAGTAAVAERDLIFSGFSFRPLSEGIPECGLGSLPLMQEPNIPLPTCANDEEVATYGDANPSTITGNNNQGSAGMPPSSILLKSITTDGLKWTKLEQIKIQINTNLNTVNRVRLGVYDSAFKLVGGTSDIVMTNTLKYMITGVLPQPIYLAPGSTYYLAFWSQNNIYVGFFTGVASVPTMRAVLVDETTPWPETFFQTNTNSARAMAGIGCFVDAPPAAGSSSSTGGSGPSGPVETSSSSKGVEGGAVAGIVVGCVIGTNLLLLALVWICCLRNSNQSTKAQRFEDSRVDNSRVEMGAV